MTTKLSLCPSSDWADIACHEARFEGFVASYLETHPNPMLRLKYAHSLNVLTHARSIVATEQLVGEEGRAALLAALYHDTGRFPQFVRWKTFSDAKSTNHGRLGVRVVKKEAFLCDESITVRHLTLAGIGMHNRYRLPAGFVGPAALVTQVVRDADKLDILRIMAQCLNDPVPSDDIVLHVLDEPERWSPHIVQAVLEGRVPGYTELVYINDFRMLLGTWLQDLQFSGSRRQLACSGHVERVLERLPDAPELEAVRKHLAEQLSNARDDRVV